MKNIIKYTALIIGIIIAIICIALYSFNLGKKQEYDTLNKKYVFDCLISPNQYLSQEEKKKCVEKMYDNKLWQMQELFIVSLAIEHLDGNYLYMLNDESYLEEVYPILFDKCFKKLDDVCIDIKLSSYQNMKKSDINNFLNDLDYIFTHKPQYVIVSHWLFMKIIKENSNICTDPKYGKLVANLKNNKSIKNAHIDDNWISDGEKAAYYGSCNKYIYNLPY